MTLSVKHTFQSAKGDPGDTTLVRPSNWNAEHTLLCATDKLLGRTSSGSGAVEEVTCTDFAQSLLACADVTAFLALVGGGFSTGDIKPTLKTSADSGWVMCNDGTIGDASSAATNRANADTSALYTLLWTNISDTYAPVTGGRGGSAAADFAAHKPIALTKMLGRALAASGAGASLTSRSLGQTLGTETETITQANLPAVTLTTTIAAGQGSHNHTTTSTALAAAGPGAFVVPSGSTTTGTSTLPEMSGTTPLGGSGTAQNNMQPTTFVNFMIKL